MARSLYVCKLYGYDRKFGYKGTCVEANLIRVTRVRLQVKSQG